MKVIVSHEGAVTMVKPMGPAVSGELEELGSELQNLSCNWAKRIIVNMSEVNYIDSAGLELFSYYASEFKNHGLQLKLSSLNEITQKIFDITRLSRRFEIFSDTSTAVRSYL